MVVKRDNENARLREQRDQMSAELHERKQRDGSRTHALNECKTLLESRSASLFTYVYIFLHD